MSPCCEAGHGGACWPLPSTQVAMHAYNNVAPDSTDSLPQPTAAAKPMHTI